MKTPANDGLIERRCPNVALDPVSDLAHVGKPCCAGPGDRHPEVSTPGKAGKADTTGAVDQPDTATTKLLLSPAEAARVLGIGRTTLFHLLGTGAIASVRIGSLRRIPIVAIDAYVDALVSDTDSGGAQANG